MCLVIQKTCKAKKTIRVYKVLTANNAAPYHKMYKYYLGINKAEHQNVQCTNNVTAGFLHAYSSMLNAVHEMLFLNTFRTPGHKIVVMYIPRGSMYHIGTNDDVACRTLVWKKDTNISL